jgi:hypothetical protein
MEDYYPLHCGALKPVLLLGVLASTSHNSAYLHGLLQGQIYRFLVLSNKEKTNVSTTEGQIRRPGFDSRHYQIKKIVGLERGPLSLVSTTEELLDRKVAAFV